MKRRSNPLDEVIWRKREDLKPNNYNPNSVAPPELKLLRISVIEDGWTQPIVINPDMTIVDGFHRWTISDHEEIRALDDGWIPTVMTTPKDEKSQQMATIRHNRARGSHSVLAMSDIIVGMLNEGLSGKEICQRLCMEKEEVVRLANKLGIPKSDIFKGEDFGTSWQPE